MIGQRSRSWSPWLCGLILAIATPAQACKVPVFRYALERWPADQYRIVAIMDGTSDETSPALAELESLRRSNANVDVETIDLSTLNAEQLWQVEVLPDEASLPVLQVFFPARDGRRKLCWSGDLTVEAVQRWRTSPLRRQLAEDILAGTSAVWILVEGTDDDENERIAAALSKALDQASGEIAIPEGVIAKADATDYLKTHPTASMDDVLRSEIPLRIEFRSHRLSRGDPAEVALRSMVNGWAAETGGRQRAFVFPVFGRGRMIEPLTADAFDHEAIVGACRYMVGQCSCTLKALNPGIDLLLEADWHRYMDDSVLIVDQATNVEPELVAIPGGPNDEADEPADARRARPTDARRVESVIGEGRTSSFRAIAAATMALMLAIGLTWRIRSAN